MNKKIVFIILFGVLISLGSPLGLIHASINPADGPAFTGYGSDFTFSYVYYLEKILNSLWIIFTAIAVIMFVIAGITFLTANGSPEKLTQARSALIWGVVGVVVGIVAYSIITIVSSIL
jgi:FtsH-binding integral membrane protein